MKELTLKEYAARFGDESRPAGPFSLSLAEAEDCAFPRRAAQSHKYTYGRAVLVAGCRGYSGAPALAANACERSGAGLTHLIVPESIYFIAAARCDGAVVTPASSDAGGGFGPEAAGEVSETIRKADACCVGPGLGTGGGAAALVEAALRDCRHALVLDADALNLCAVRPGLLDSRRAETILTPHEGEFRRLGGEPGSGRLAGALAFTAAHENVILILKGHGTLICRGREAVVNPTGTPAMAKGGSGDVLSGILTALLAQGFEPWPAARAAVYLHGLAGEIACERYGEYGVTPSDLIAALPEAFRRVRPEESP